MKLCRLTSVMLGVLLLFFAIFGMAILQGDGENAIASNLNDLKSDQEEVNYLEKDTWSLKVVDVEYKENTAFPDKENVYVLIDIENKNGANQEFIPEGTLQFIGASGKIYVQEDGKAWNMQSFIEKINKIRKYRKEISNLGIVKIGVPVLIDRGDQIVAMIYNDGLKKREIKINYEKVLQSSTPGY